MFRSAFGKFRSDVWDVSFVSLPTNERGCHFSPPKSDEKAPLIFAYAKRIGESRGGYEALNGNYLLALYFLPLTYYR